MSQYYYNPFGNSSDVNERMENQYLLLNRKKQEKRDIRAISFTMGCAIIAYLILQNVLALLLLKFDLYDLYENSPVFSYSFYVFAVSFLSVLVPFGIMALVNKKKYAYPPIPKTPVKPVNAAAWIGFGMGCCIVANFAVSYIIAIINTITGRELSQSEMAEPNSVFSCILLAICLAVMPGICEELAMRCFSLQLLRKYGKGFAVFAVSIVFGLLHGNVTQFIFAFLVGMVLGFVTVKTDSIVPAMFIHAFNNGMSVVQYIVKYAAGESWANGSTVAVYIFWFVAAVASVVYLLVNKQFKSDKKEKPQTVLTIGERFVAFLFPWMIVPFLSLIGLTVLNALES